MNYAWAIDQRKCIGCHACTTACKSENEVPLSVDRTWVKYVEKGSYPNSQRHFGVMRCNHCAKPPCVDICPVTAMFQREDGIVEFDSDVCIGCKACIAACPYDAIYIDPENGTAAKCNFCTHRLDVGLEPACVVVCPEEALIFGDLDDPLSRVSELVGREKTQVRKPEKNTEPKCFYIGADEAVLNPEVQTHDPSGMYMWSLQREEKHGGHLDHNLEATATQERNGGRQVSGLSLSAALNKVTGARVAYDVHHDIPWGKDVSLYLWTKSMASGIFLMTWLFWTMSWSQRSSKTLEEATTGGISALGVFLPLTGPDWTFWLGPVVSGIALALTGLFLVRDLDRPERFWTILTRPQWKSWLAIGAYIITAYGLMLIVDLALFACGNLELLNWCLHLTMPLSIMTASYTAFLFAQAKGRDLWQSPLLPVHLLVQALIAGSAASLAGGWILADQSGLIELSVQLLTGCLIAHAAMVISGEILIEHSSKAKERAVKVMTSGRYRTLFWDVGLTCGVILPLILLGSYMIVGESWLLPVASALSISGLLAYEHCFVMAGQSVRLS